MNYICRGGASEASVATLTGDVDGSSRYHAQMVLSQQFFEIHFLPGK